MWILLIGLLQLCTSRIELHYLAKELLLTVYRPSFENGVEQTGPVYIKSDYGSIVPVKTYTRDRDGVKWRVAEFHDVKFGAMLMVSDESQIDFTLEELTETNLEGEPDCQPQLLNNLMLAQNMFAVTYTTASECRYNSLQSEHPTHNNTYNRLEGTEDWSKHQYLHQGQYIMHPEDYFKYRIQWQLKVEEDGIESHGAIIIYKNVKDEYTTVQYPTYAVVSSIIPQRSEPAHFSPQLLQQETFGVAFIYDSPALDISSYINLLEEWGERKLFYSFISVASKDWTVNSIKQLLLGGRFTTSETYEFGDYTIIVVQPESNITKLVETIIKKRVDQLEGYIAVLHAPLCSNSDDICQAVTQAYPHQQLFLELRHKLASQSLALIESDTERLNKLDKIVWNMTFQRFKETIVLPGYIETMKQDVPVVEYELQQTATAFSGVTQWLQHLLKEAALANLELASGVWGLIVGFLMLSILWGMHALHRSLTSRQVSQK